MACFVSSGNGEDTCIRYEVSTSVSGNEENAQGFTLSVQPNPVTTQNEAIVHIRGAAELKRVGLYDVTGREVQNLTSFTEKEGNDEYTVVVEVSDLPSGHYFCRVVSGERLHTIPVIIE